MPLHHHIVTILSRDHDLIKAEEKNPCVPGDYLVHTLTPLENSSKDEIRRLMNQVLQLSVRPGQSLVIICDEDHLLEEYIVTMTMFRRLGDTVNLFVKRNERACLLPWLQSLRKEHPVSTDYKYNCGGNCSSCGEK